MKIYACPRCGSRNISMGTLSSGIMYGVTSLKEECKNCGFRGFPLIFDSKKEYVKFLEAIHEDIDKEKDNQQDDTFD